MCTEIENKGLAFIKEYSAEELVIILIYTGWHYCYIYYILLSVISLSSNCINMSFMMLLKNYVAETDLYYSRYL
jgi:hypothetical protein